MIHIAGSSVWLTSSISLWDLLSWAESRVILLRCPEELFNLALIAGFIWILPAKSDRWFLRNKKHPPQMRTMVLGHIDLHRTPILQSASEMSVNMTQPRTLRIWDCYFKIMSATKNMWIFRLWLKGWVKILWWSHEEMEPWSWNLDDWLRKIFHYIPTSGDWWNWWDKTWGWRKDAQINGWRPKFMLPFPSSIHVFCRDSVPWKTTGGIFLVIWDSS